MEKNRVQRNKNNNVVSKNNFTDINEYPNGYNHSDNYMNNLFGVNYYNSVEDKYSEEMAEEYAFPNKSETTKDGTKKPQKANQKSTEKQESQKKEHTWKKERY